jgi:hypothetical protein
MSKSQKTQSDSKAKTPAPGKTEESEAANELSGEELEAVAGGVLTMANLQGGSLSSLKQQQLTPSVGVDTSLPSKGGDLL